jgi:DNA-binding CsgD family transcriptional regulator
VTTATAGRHELGAVLLGASYNLLRKVGASVTSFIGFLPDHDQTVAEVRGALGDDVFNRLFDQGAHLDLEDAAAAALGTATGAEAKARRRQPAPDGAPMIATIALTPREQEVAQLVALGLSNKEIATTLGIAQRTAEAHVEHILNKLGFTSRAQIAACIAARNND